MTVQSREQALLLQDIAYVSVLGQLLKGEASASEVATGTSQTLQQAHHKLTRMLNAGLIELHGERTRGGRPVKIYGPVAREYRVPFALTDAASVGELIQASHRPLLALHYEAMSRLQTADLLIRQSERGQMAVTLDIAEEHASSPLNSVFMGVRLTPETVDELQDRLTELACWIGHQALKDAEKGEDYLLGLLLTPGKVKNLEC